MDKDTL